ncbi:MAG: family 1 extracellular solute-binding protein [Paenibacillaceae bacterium]|nr:family 1 extracellular solute-binding protein [Paenibacillaceae bacterium]
MGKKSFLLLVSVFLAGSFILSGCSSKRAEPLESKGQGLTSEPLELIVYGNANKSPTDFDDFFVNPVKKKYPNITLKLIDKATGGQPDKFIASGEMPDILYDSPPGILFYQDLDMIEDMGPYIKKYPVDFQRFDPTVIDMLKAYGKGKIFALPLLINFSALFYNKDIFDKFAVPYPKDGMTWDDAIDLVRKVSRSSDGVQYYGLDTGVVSAVSGQMSLGFVDPATDKATFNTDGWRKLFQFMQDMYSVPGNHPDKPRNNNTLQRDAFIKSKTLAMSADWGINAIGQFTDLYNQGISMNWDMATLPYFKETPGVSRKIDAHLLYLSKGSKHKDDAFQIINYLINDENELLNAKAGRLPSIVNPEIRKQFGTDVPALKGKNMNVIYNYKAAKQFTPTSYDQIATNAVTSAYYNSVYSGDKDINTALREAQEAADKAIAEQKNK